MNIKGIWVSKNGIEYPIFGDFLEYLTDRLLLPLVHSLQLYSLAGFGVQTIP